MFAAALRHGPKTSANLDTFDCRDTHQAMRNRRLELVEDGFTESRWNLARYDADLGANRVLISAQSNHEGFELFNTAGVGTEERVVIDD